MLPTSPSVVKTLVVKRDDGISHSQTAITIASQPNVDMVAASPLRVIAIRAARVFVQTLIPSISIASFSNLIALKTAVLLAAAASVMAILQNTGELLAKLDQTHPELRG